MFKFKLPLIFKLIKIPKEVNSKLFFFKCIGYDSNIISVKLVEIYLQTYESTKAKKLCSIICNNLHLIEIACYPDESYRIYSPEDLLLHKLVQWSAQSMLTSLPEQMLSLSYLCRRIQNKVKLSSISTYFS